jgi:hypothetical protein
MEKRFHPLQNLHTDLSYDNKRLFYLGLFIYFLLTNISLVAQNQVVYRSDFNSNNFNNWYTPPATDLIRQNNLITSPKANPQNRFLGPLGIQIVQLNLKNLPPHDSVTISYSLYMIATMDGSAPPGNGEWGPDLFGLTTSEGDTLLWTTFSNGGHAPEQNVQAYPDRYPNAVHPATTGALPSSDLSIWNSEYKLSFTFYSSSSSLSLNFVGHQTQEMYDESWGMDSVVVSVSGSSSPIINAQSTQSLAIPLCDSVTRDTLYARNTGSGTLSISSSNFAQGNAGYNVISPNSYPVSITPGDSVGFVVQFAPLAVGTFSDTLLLYNNDTITGHDPWRIAFSGKRDAIALQAPALNFGNVIASNFPATKTLTVKNTGTLPITINAGNFNGATPFTVISGLPVTIAPGDSASITLQFNDPGNDSLFTDTLHFMYSPVCSSFATVISGRRESLPPIIKSLQQQTFNALVCDSLGYDTVYVLNTGGSTLVIDSNSFIQGNLNYNVTTPSSFPVTISPSDSLRFIIRFTPQTQGTFSDTLLLYNNDTVTGHDPWRIAFSGKRDAIALQAPALNFGNVIASNFPATKTLTVTNTGSLPVTISAGYFNGAAPFVIVSGLPATIPPGGSAQIVVRFDDPGLDTLYSDTMHFIFSPECSPFGALITGSRGNTPPVIQTSVQSVSNEIPCGGPVLDTVFVANAGGTPLLLSSANFIAGTQGFSVVTPTAFPVSVPPNDSTMFIVLFQPSGPGAFSDTLLIADNDTISSHDPWRIAFSGKKDAPQYIGTLSTSIMQAAPGDTIIVPIVLQSPNPVSGVQLTMHIRYNASVLLPISAKDGTIDSIGMGVLVLTSNGNSTTDTIAWVKFIVALGDSVNSSISFDTLLTGNCPVTFSQTGGGVQLTGLCQQGGTRLFVNNGTLSLSQNAPNPFSSTTYITFSTIESGETRLTVSNVLGQTVATLMDGNVPVGLHTVSFDASNLRSGTYYYTLLTPTQSLRKSMVIAK